ncbi:MFS transporter [Paraburkholderia phymatum]|uniref:MFS transporter n=1 Tax=Paraburkholderia phymatum TaxID=148447 RepID=UPI00316D0751
MNTPMKRGTPHERPTPLLRLVTQRIIPFLLLCWLMAFIDRVNIGFAQLQIKQDLGFGDAVYGLGAGIFFIGYVLFEVPSNIYLERIGARKTFSRIMICWGATSALTMLIRTPEHFYIMRFLLGAFEAGFFPGLVYYLSRWFPETYRARVISWFYVTAAFSGIIGGLMSGAIIHFLNDLHGLRGWQWMFMIEGIPCIILGIISIFYLDDSADNAKWLTAEQKVELKALLSRP